MAPLPPSACARALRLQAPPSTSEYHRMASPRASPQPGCRSGAAGHFAGIGIRLQGPPHAIAGPPGGDSCGHARSLGAFEHPIGSHGRGVRYDRTAGPRSLMCDGLAAGTIGEVAPQLEGSLCGGCVVRAFDPAQGPHLSTIVGVFMECFKLAVPDGPQHEWLRARDRSFQILDRQRTSIDRSQFTSALVPNCLVGSD
jgi:hypothetical protein